MSEVMLVVLVLAVAVLLYFLFFKDQAEVKTDDASTLSVLKDVQTAQVVEKDYASPNDEMTLKEIDNLPHDDQRPGSLVAKRKELKKQKKLEEEKKEKEELELLEKERLEREKQKEEDEAKKAEEEKKKLEEEKQKEESEKAKQEEEQKKKAEEEKQKEESERAKQESEKQKADEEKKKAEEEKQKEELEKSKQESEKQKENEEKKRAEEEKQKEESEKAKQESEKQKADEEQKKAEEEKQKEETEKSKQESEKQKEDEEKKRAEEEKQKEESEKAKQESEKQKADEEQKKAEEEKQKEEAEKSKQESEKQKADEEQKKAAEEEGSKKSEGDDKKKAEEERIAKEVEAGKLAPKLGVGIDRRTGPCPPVGVCPDSNDIVNLSMDRCDCGRVLKRPCSVCKEPYSIWWDECKKCHNPFGPEGAYEKPSGSPAPPTPPESRSGRLFPWIPEEPVADKGPCPHCWIPEQDKNQNECKDCEIKLGKKCATCQTPSTPWWHSCRGCNARNKFEADPEALKDYANRPPPRVPPPMEIKIDRRNGPTPSCGVCPDSLHIVTSAAEKCDCGRRLKKKCPQCKEPCCIWWDECQKCKAPLVPEGALPAADESQPQPHPAAESRAKKLYPYMPEEPHAPVGPCAYCWEPNQDMKNERCSDCEIKLPKKCTTCRGTIWPWWQKCNNCEWPNTFEPDPANVEELKEWKAKKEGITPPPVVEEEEEEVVGLPRQGDPCPEAGICPDSTHIIDTSMDKCPCKRQVKKNCAGCNEPYFIWWDECKKCHTKLTPEGPTPIPKGEKPSRRAAPIPPSKRNKHRPQIPKESFAHKGPCANCWEPDQDWNQAKCSDCGIKLSKTCTTCKGTIWPWWYKCNNCGWPNKFAPDAKALEAWTKEFKAGGAGSPKSGSLSPQEAASASEKAPDKEPKSGSLSPQEAGSASEKAPDAQPKNGSLSPQEAASASEKAPEGETPSATGGVTIDNIVDIGAPDIQDDSAKAASSSDAAKPSEAAPSETAQPPEAPPSETAKAPEAAPSETAKAPEAAPPSETAQPPEAPPSETAKAPEAAAPSEIGKPPEATPPSETAQPPEAAPPSETAKAPEAVPSETAPPPEAPPSETAKAPEAAPPSETAQPPEGAPPSETAKAPEAAPPSETAKAPEAASSETAPPPPEAPSSETGKAPEAAPSETAKAPEAAPPSETAQPPEAPPSETAKAPEAAPSETAKAPEGAPSETAPPPEAPPSETAKAPEAAPSETAKAPEAAPSESAKAPEAAPSETAKAPEAAPSETAKAPEAAPSESAKAPEAAPSETAKAAEGAPSQSPEATPSETAKAQEDPSKAAQPSDNSLSKVDSILEIGAPEDLASPSTPDSTDAPKSELESSGKEENI